MPGSGYISCAIPGYKRDALVIFFIRKREGLEQQLLTKATFDIQLKTKLVLKVDSVCS